ncbi:MAG: class I SAM-dependent methyltransferase [Lachnospiraceae bacterium]|jgi:2-polyprenyl-3-methyl-5-hydroxy-6-metoxy-1,4-benzoquinol methylase|nr:class I SAM-dependent methyltransferase [Lachnospiraceae bacterium]
MNKSFDTTWEDIHKTQEWGKYPSEDIIRFIARNYYKKERSNIKILDFGCGAGANTWYLAREGFDTFAFDGSDSAISKAKSYLKKDNLEAHFEVADALDISYPNEFFDCIIDSAVVYANTIKNITDMYKKTYDLLVLGGKLFSTGLFTPNTTGYGTGLSLEKNTFKDLTEGALSGRGTVHFFEKEEVSELLNAAGFHHINIDMVRRTDKGNIVEYWMASAEK